MPRGFKTPTETADRIVSLYQSGVSAPAVGEMLGLNPETVRGVLIGRGIGIRFNRIIPKDQRSAIAEMYRAGMTMREIGEKVGASVPTVHAWVREAEVETRHRKYTVREDYFTNLDSPNKYWLLGFLATDGHLKSGDGGFTITLQERDREILERINQELGSEYPITSRVPRPSICNGRVVRGGPAVTLNVCSKQIGEDLRRLGFTPNKTWTIRPVEGPPEMMGHFYRGCIDGDGSIIITSDRGTERGGGRTRVTIFFCGNRFMVDGWAGYVRERFGAVCNPYRHSSIFAAYVTRQRYVQEILRELYADAPIALARKHAKAMAGMVLQRKRRDHSGITSEELLTARRDTSGWMEVGRRFQIPGVGIYQLLRTRGIPIH